MRRWREGSGRRRGPVIDSTAVRVGFVTQLLWNRYGAFWERLVADAGAVVEFAKAEDVAVALQHAAVVNVPTLAFRYAAAQAAALAGCDLLIVPDLNVGSEAERGGGQDRWIADFPQALKDALGVLPALQAVPTELGAAVEGVAVPLLHQLVGDPGMVTRVWTRHRIGARARLHVRGPVWSVAGRATVGILGQPWTLTPSLLAALRSETDHLVAQTMFEPSVLREEGTRGDARFIPSDAEVLGAARLFSRRGSVERLTFVADNESGADAWLLQRVREVAKHKHVELRYVQDLVASGGTRLLVDDAPSDEDA